MSRSCKECAHDNPDFIDEVCLHCSWPEFAGEPSNFKPKPLTNADRIRSMTGEELAEWLDDICKSAYDEGYTKETGEPLMSPYPSTASEWITWLKAEATW